MLVQYTVKNFKTFETEAKLSLVASKYFSEREEDNTIYYPQFDIRLLKSAVIYGANASGKSKLFESFNFFKNFILSSSKDKQINEPIDLEEFKLNTETENQPSFFVIIFIYKNEIYRYGFEATKSRIISEWLYYRPKTKEVELFYRNEQEFEIHEKKFKVKDLIDNNRIRPNALLLSTAAHFNDKIAGLIVNWIADNLNVISGLREEDYIGFSIGKLKNEKNKNEILNFIKNADLNIDDLSTKFTDYDDLPKELKIIYDKKREDGIEFFSDVHTYHKKFNKTKDNNTLIKFSMDYDESSGTKKYFALSGPILETLKNGEILIIDELDAKLHPNLTKKIIELFNSKDKNPKNAQLIFNTHDTNLLDTDIFRRDQIWFTEKDRYGAAVLYSLSDIKGIRKEDLLEKNYISGKYGAIPFLGNFEKLFND